MRRIELRWTDERTWKLFTMLADTGGGYARLVLLNQSDTRIPGHEEVYAEFRLVIS